MIVKFSIVLEKFIFLQYKDCIKAWYLHKESSLNYVCIKGKVRLVLFDDRKNSSTVGQYQEIILSLDDYFLVTIPPNI